MKRETPYSRLLRQAQNYYRSVRFATRQTMWVYAKKDLSAGWELSGLAERVQAAKQLGWNVELTVDDDGALRVSYVKRPDEPAWYPRF